MSDKLQNVYYSLIKASVLVTYLETFQAYMMERFWVVNGSQPVTIFAKKLYHRCFIGF